MVIDTDCIGSCRSNYNQDCDGPSGSLYDWNDTPTSHYCLIFNTRNTDCLILIWYNLLELRYKGHCSFNFNLIQFVCVSIHGSRFCIFWWYTYPIFWIEVCWQTCIQRQWTYMTPNECLKWQLDYTRTVQKFPSYKAIPFCKEKVAL